MRDEMTEDQVAANVAAQLVPGKYYRFAPPIMATAVPVGGPNVCKLEECEFDRGWYIGLVNGNHVFQGKPVNDERIIPTPPGYQDVPNLNEILEQLRDSYFHVLFIDGSQAVLDTDQGHH
ncbi:MAG: hypothetical protein A2562_00730 [Candidatus Nealsonbacteria bacterium RIFOXYD1_FULL_39_11]|nr:MAG: hypothetical protein A2562_00730 [Candidatus Nealsonbacteria bacterium RIFOXYD1_FULL_39_11]